MKRMDLSRISRDLMPEHRTVMLDLVLTWGSLDGALGMLVGSLHRTHPVEGAELVKGMGAGDRFRAVIEVLKVTPGADDAAKKMRRYKRVYERYSKARNSIAHSHCAGYLTDDPDRIVFLPYEKVGRLELAVDVIYLSHMRDAIRWGREMQSLALRVFDEVNANTPE